MPITPQIYAQTRGRRRYRFPARLTLRARPAAGLAERAGALPRTVAAARLVLPAGLARGRGIAASILARRKVQYSHVRLSVRGVRLCALHISASPGLSVEIEPMPMARLCNSAL